MVNVEATMEILTIIKTRRDSGSEWNLNAIHPIDEENNIIVS